MLPAQAAALSDHTHPRVALASVDTAGLADNAVTNPKLADNAVNTAELTNLAVTVGKLATAVQEALAPTGAVVAYGGTAAPNGWLLCDGAAVSRSTFAALFAVVGTAFGAGDGSTTFNVPDLRQRFPLGKATSGTGATLGGTGGTIDHVHDLDTSSSHAKINAASDVLHHLRKTVASYNETVSATSITTAATAVAQTLGTGLGGDSAAANPPFQAVNFLVKT